MNEWFGLTTVVIVTFVIRTVLERNKSGWINAVLR